MKNRNEKRFTLIELPVVSRVKAQAFTLIELLVVIGIIALLAAMLFPAIGSVRKHARKVEAQAAMTGLKAAISQYEAQYGLLPTNYGGTDVVFFQYDNDVNSESAGAAADEEAYDILIEHLSCANVRDDTSPYTYYENTRKTRFISIPASGSNDSERTITDPYVADIPGSKYGMRYGIAMDTDGSNSVWWRTEADKDQTTVAPTNAYTLNGKIFIWSFGKNNRNEWGWGDDVPSWD